MTKDHMYIIGSGGHAKSLASICLANSITKFSFIDPHTDKNDLLGIEILNYLPKNSYFIVGIGDNYKRKKLFDNYQIEGCFPANLVAKSAVISINSIVNAGVFIGPGVYVGPEVVIGHNTIINTRAVIEHDSCVGSNAHISVNATIAGSVTIGDLVFVGAGAIIIDGITVCNNVIIGAGAVVTKDINEPGTYVGIPAKKLEIS